MDQDKLLSCYKSFGEDPFITNHGLTSVPISAWYYARERCYSICSGEALPVPEESGHLQIKLLIPDEQRSRAIEIMQYACKDMPEQAARRHLSHLFWVMEMGKTPEEKSSGSFMILYLSNEPEYRK